MAKQHRVKEVDYPRLIARHLTTRLHAQPKEQIDRVLELTGLHWAGDVVRPRSGAPIGAETSRRYKQAVGEVFGSAAQGMAQVNFKLAGCECQDCLRTSLDEISSSVTRTPNRR